MQPITTVLPQFFQSDHVFYRGTASILKLRRETFGALFDHFKTVSNSDFGRGAAPGPHKGDLQCPGKPRVFWVFE